MTRTTSYLAIWFLVPLVIALGLSLLFGGHGFEVVGSSLIGLAISGIAISGFILRLSGEAVLSNRISALAGAIAGLFASFLMWLMLGGWRFPIDMAYMRNLAVITTVLVVLGIIIGVVASVVARWWEDKLSS